jgi:hypothetical protein
LESQENSQIGSEEEHRQVIVRTYPTSKVAGQDNQHQQSQSQPETPQVEHALQVAAAMADSTNYRKQTRVGVRTLVGAADLGVVGW